MTLLPFNIKNCPLCGNTFYYDYGSYYKMVFESAKYFYVRCRPQTWYRKQAYMFGRCGLCRGTWWMMTKHDSEMINGVMGKKDGV